MIVGFGLLLNELLSQEREVKLVRREMEIQFAGKIISIIGTRRAGKTFFKYQKINDLRNNNLKDKIIYINFEDERLLPIKKEGLNS